MNCREQVREHIDRRKNAILVDDRTHAIYQTTYPQMEGEAQLLVPVPQVPGPESAHRMRRDLSVQTMKKLMDRFSKCSPSATGFGAPSSRPKTIAAAGLHATTSSS